MKLQNDIPVSEMNYGEIGVITSWGVHTHRVGSLIQRYGENSLLLLQQNDWYDNMPIGEEFRVRILQKGETLIIE